MGHPVLTDCNFEILTQVLIKQSLHTYWISYGMK